MIKYIKDEEAYLALDYLNQDPDFNITSIGHLMHYPVDHNHEVYLQYQDNEIIAFFEKYYTRGFFYSHLDNGLYQEIADVISSKILNRILGTKINLEAISSYLYHIKHRVYFTYSKLDHDAYLMNDNDVITASSCDVEEIFEYMKTTQFLKDNYVEINQKKINVGAGRIYFIKHDDKIIASGETVIETSNGAIIGEVSTHMDYRNRGIGTKLVSKLCIDLLKENKVCFLFYNNLHAKSIYHKLGFIDIGDYMMLVL